MVICLWSWSRVQVALFKIVAVDVDDAGAAFWGGVADDFDFAFPVAFGEGRVFFGGGSGGVALRVGGVVVVVEGEVVGGGGGGPPA